MSRSTMSVLTVALCGAAVLAGQTLLSWTALAGGSKVAIPDLNGVDALQVKGRGDVQIVTAAAPSLTITDDERSTIKVWREGSKLVIEVKGWFAGDPHFVLHGGPLRSLELSGSVELAADELAGKDVLIATSGSSEAKIGTERAS